MDIVCVDTPILLYAIKEEESLDQPGMVDKTKRFFNKLEENGVLIMIPSVVYAEFLSLYPTEFHITLNNLLQKDYHIASFDVKAANIFALIREKKYDVLQQFKLKPQYSPAKLLVDCQIIATAVAQGAKRIYSEEETIHELAASFIHTSFIPNITEQLRLHGI